jgi:hypothetical protein
MQHPNHSSHDVLLIAGHAAGDLVDSERTRAQSLVDSCGSCADLHRDLVAIAAATRSLPNLAPAPRDFRLAPEQAARLRRGSWLRTILAPFVAARSAARPMAAAFTTLGIAGLLVATMLPGLSGSAATSGLERDQSQIGATAASAAPVGPVVGPGEPAPNATDGSPAEEFGVKDQGGPSSAPGAGGGGTGAGAADEGSPTGRIAAMTSSPLLVGSLALLALGLLLFGLRFAARRLSA